MIVDVTVLLLSILLLEVFITCLVIGVLIVYLSKDTTQIPEILSRVMNVEGLVEQLSHDVSSELNGSTEIWKTFDGRYTASSFEELLSKMSSDPNGPLTDDELDTLRSIFKKITGNEEDE